MAGSFLSNVIIMQLSSLSPNVGIIIVGFALAIVFFKAKLYKAIALILALLAALAATFGVLG